MKGDGISVTQQFSRRAVAEALLRDGAASRADLARKTGLSRKSVSSAIADLEAARRVKRTDASERRATRYEIDRSAAYALGVDLGGTKVAAAIADLVGDIVAEATEPTDPRGGAHVFQQIKTLADTIATREGLDARRIQSVAVGTPGVVDPATGELALAPNIAGLSSVSGTKALAELFGQSVAIENDANLAVLGEISKGCARDCANVAFIALGTGIGLGLVANGGLIRGATGAAGEIAYLPLGPDLFSADALTIGALELEVGAAGIVRRYREIGERPLETVRDVFSAAEGGDQPALRVLDATADGLALAITALQSILDTEMIVLGGSIGARPELVARVQSRLEALFARPIAIRASSLGARAGLVGAVSLAVRTLHKDVFQI